MSWQNFERNETTYDLSHLSPLSFTYTRAGDPEREIEDQVLKFSVHFSHHCFTGHIGDSDWVYPHEYDERYFCETRYELSKNLPAFIRKLLDLNPYFLRTFFKHREQFFYIEDEYHGETYRLFLEISCPQGPYADVRIDVKSAYHEEDYAQPVSGDNHFKLWRIIDARLKKIALPKRKERGRRRR